MASSQLVLMLSSGNHNCAAAGAADREDWTAFQLQVQEADASPDLCPAWGDCKLQDLAYEYQVSCETYGSTRCSHPQELTNPLIVRDFSRCILCGRCVQACNEIQVNNAISFGYRGAHAKIVAAGDRPLRQSDCVFCGECVQVCPVGALVEKKTRHTWRPWTNKKIRSTCPYCGVGCQLWLHVQDEKIVKVTGVEEARPNQGRLCIKGRFGYDFIYSQERLKTPLIRQVDWTPPAEVPDKEYPLVLSTGRRLAHYHTRTQTGRCEGFNDILGEETADISPEDAETLDIEQGDIIQVISRRGRVRVRAKITREVPEGLVWMAFHFRQNNANWLTIDAFDPITMTAEYKACAVRIEKLKP